MTDKLNAVFVYGTLRPSKEATHELWGYKMYDYGRFPYLFEGNSAYDKVVGNVIYVTDEQLEQLDHYEGVERGLYTRQTVEVWPEGKEYSEEEEELECYVYVATDRLHPKRISSGDWFQR